MRSDAWNESHHFAPGELAGAHFYHGLAFYFDRS